MYGAVRKSCQKWSFRRIASQQTWRVMRFYKTKDFHSYNQNTPLKSSKWKGMTVRSEEQGECRTPSIYFSLDIMHTVLFASLVMKISLTFQP